MTDGVAREWLHELNPSARSLQDHYREGLPRREIYDRITDTILAAVRTDARVCAAFYGHPGVFVYPSHEAVRRARAEGFRATMLPAVSAEDCLFADLGVDPGATGCQSYEATDFLIRERQIDPTAALILWQVSVIGERIYSTGPREHRLGALVEYLGNWYEREHVVTLYEAAPYPFARPLIKRIALGDLQHAEPSPLATLYVPPAAVRDPDPEMIARLGLAAG